MVKIFLLLFATALAIGEPSIKLKNGDYNRYYLSNSLTTELELTTKPTFDLVIRYVPTVIVVHGHQASYQTSLNPDVRRELLASQNVNVIAVDWSIYASMSYENAQKAVLGVGESLATFLGKLNVDPLSLHLVGFDLGAHIVGIAGRMVGGRIARITGLSPTTSNVKLASTDAKYVEVIHTGVSCSNPNVLEERLGNADFYPNGGRCQPGCPDNNCQYNRSWMYFVASIKDNKFNANCCDTMYDNNIDRCRGPYLTMGTNALSKIPCPSGIYRVNTRDRYPF